ELIGSLALAFVASYAQTLTGFAVARVTGPRVGRTAHPSPPDAALLVGALPLAAAAQLLQAGAREGAWPAVARVMGRRWPPRDGGGMDARPQAGGGALRAGAIPRRARRDDGHLPRCRPRSQRPCARPARGRTLAPRRADRPWQVRGAAAEQLSHLSVDDRRRAIAAGYGRAVRPARDARGDDGVRVAGPAAAVRLQARGRGRRKGDTAGESRDRAVDAGSGPPRDHRRRVGGRRRGRRAHAGARV